MTYTDEQLARASEQQNIAAHDNSQIIRLVAGPGTGKSRTIQKRVCWLLENGIHADNIYVISFTRASVLDLKQGIRKFCNDNNVVNSELIKVSTLHSLALRILRRANLLFYPGTPTILDDWEVVEIYDKEFSKQNNNHGHYPPTRCGEIRVDYEAYCSSGQYLPPMFIPPNPPISEPERNDFRTYHHTRNQIYSCVLPGELVKQCVENIEAGAIDVVDLLGITNLIVDEYQDLNPIDLHFIDLLINQNITTFIAGDDDQSIYSFRLASPKGIQEFTSQNRFPNAFSHEITDCFRCTPEILSTAQTLIDHFSEPRRLPKHTTSLYLASNPRLNGNSYRWQFQSDIDEANAIGLSCRELINHGISANKIAILLTNTKIQLSVIKNALSNFNLNFEFPKEHEFIDSEIGRFIYGLLRIICDENDYFAYRLLLGIYPRIGIITCNNIASRVFENNVNYRNIFNTNTSDGIFTAQQINSLKKIRDLCQSINGWVKDDTLILRNEEIYRIVGEVFPELESWTRFTSVFPEGTTLEEIRDYMGARTINQKNLNLISIYERLHQPIPENGFFVPKIRIMTMHGMKGLSSDIVFIPGLEESILPGEYNAHYPGLVFESARLLYVSITRAKAACILSFSSRRYFYGQVHDQAQSRFIPFLSGPFQHRETGLTDQEIENITFTINNL